MVPNRGLSMLNVTGTAGTTPEVAFRTITVIVDWSLPFAINQELLVLRDDDPSGMSAVTIPIRRKSPSSITSIRFTLIPNTLEKRIERFEYINIFILKKTFKIV
jgi:hypothetical protein